MNVNRLVVVSISNSSGRLMEVELLTLSTVLDFDHKVLCTVKVVKISTFT
jgi:hypothetical protein